MVTTAASDYSNSTDTFDVVYRVTPPALSNGPTAYFINETSGTQDLTTNSYYNTSSYPVSASGWNVRTLKI